MIATGTQVSRRFWWVLAIRGVFAVVFGLIAIVFPLIALLALVYLFGAYAILDGITAVVVALEERRVLGRWWVLLLEGLVSIIVGLVAFVLTGITALFLLYLIASWAVVTGVIEIAAAFMRRGSMAQEWTLAIAGILSIIFGVILFVHPGAGILAILWLLGVYAIIFGILLIVRAFQFRSSAAAV